MSETEKLAERLDHLERRVQELERIRAPQPSLPPGHDFGPVDTWPYRPMVPNHWPVGPIMPVPSPTTVMGQCPKCGLQLSPVMGYVCSQTDCPTGLGGARCVSIAQDPLIGNLTSRRPVAGIRRRST